MDDKLEKLINILKENRVSLIIHAGDITSLDLIQKLETIAPVNFIQGNMDFGLKFKSVPKYLIIDYYNKKIGVYHGSGGSDGFKERVYFFFQSKNLINSIDIIICGHIHNGFIEKYNEKLIINPGSPFPNRFAKINSIAILKAEIDESKNEIKNLNANLIELKY